MVETPGTEPVGKSRPAPDFTGRKRAAVALCVVAAFLTGLDAAVAPPPPNANISDPTTADLISSVVVGLASVMWLRWDARERGRSAAVWGVCAFVLSIVVVPIWLIVTRRRRCWRSLAVYLGVLLALGFAGAAGDLLGTALRR